MIYPVFLKGLAVFAPAICGLIFTALPAVAGNLTISLTNQNEEAVDEAVVILVAKQAHTDLGSDTTHTPTLDAVMAQRDLSFIPHVLPVQAGTEVAFPNQDQTRHHVYSFSDAKTFELKLYDGDEARSVLFDQPGIVVLGCNIHDNMLGYIYVSASDLFTKSNENGQAVFNNLEPGAYDVQIWHPRLRGKPADYSFTATVTKDENVSVATQIKLRRKRRNSSPY